MVSGEAGRKTSAGIQSRRVNPRYPIYIPSRGRAESRLTVKALDAIGVPYHVVVEPAQYEQYAAVIPADRLLKLPWDTDGTGLVRARNWIWEHALTTGAERHWQLDDNIRAFRRLWNAKRIRVADGAVFAAIEDFADRYENLAQAGMHYNMFGTSETLYHGGKMEPILFNTRIYSCTLNLNSLPFRYRGIYNDDTDLSLRILKAGWCTVIFRTFLCEKQRTMTVRGGNTPIYQNDMQRDGQAVDGRLLMAQALAMQHPDVTKIVRKWGRWQHQVDYRPFRNNQLRRKPGVVIPEGVNNYGLRLVPIDQAK